MRRVISKQIDMVQRIEFIETCFENIESLTNQTDN